MLHILVGGISELKVYNSYQQYSLLAYDFQPTQEQSVTFTCVLAYLLWSPPPALYMFFSFFSQITFSNVDQSTFSKISHMM